MNDMPPNTEDVTNLKEKPKDPLLWVPALHLVFILITSLLSLTDKNMVVPLFIMNAYIVGIDTIAFTFLVFFKNLRRLAFGFKLSGLLVFIVGWGLCFAQLAYYDL